jgi:DNA-binding protein HU-beta
VNKSQLIDRLSERFEGNRKAASHALESVLDTITREVARGEKVAITGFGSFEKRIRPARTVRNPRTGEKIKAKKTAVPKFNAGADLKAVVSGAKKLPKLTLTAATTGAKAATTGAKAATGGAVRTAKKAAPTRKAATQSTTAKKAPAKKTAAKTTPAKKTTTKKAAPAKKTTTAKKSSPAKKTTTAKKSSPAKKTTAKKTAKKS